LVVGALLILGGYEEFSYYPEPDTTSTPVYKRNLEAKNYMLELVNEARGQAGAPPVTLGTNVAAQLHAEQGVEECTTSHWDRYGLKPYMRYSLAGGSNHNAENIATYFTCVDGETEGAFSWSLLFDHDVETAVEDAVQGLLDSPGHRETLLEPDYSVMNAGVSWNKQAFNIVQQFETDFVEFSKGPELKDGVLEMEGHTKELPDFDGDYQLLALIYYDSPLVRLRPNQLVRTSCYSQGDPIVVIRQPAPPGRRYEDKALSFRENLETCPDPYRISGKVPSPTSVEDVERLSDRADRAVRETEVDINIEFVEADEWATDGNGFQVIADLSNVVGEPGIYTVLLALLQSDEVSHSFAEKSFFHDVKPPRYYASAQ